MMSIFARLLLLLAGMAIASAAESLRLLLPKGYLPSEILRPFEEKHQCTVLVRDYEEPEQMRRLFEENGPETCDLLIATDYTIPELIRKKRLAPLRRDHLSNLSQISPGFRHLLYDPEARYTAPFQFGTLGVLARRSSRGKTDESWSLLFDPEKRAGKIVLLDSMRDTIGAALKFGGHSFNSASEPDLVAARDILIRAVQSGAVLSNSFEAKQAVLAGKAAAALVYSGEGARAMAADPNLYYFVPREGSEVWVDNLTIMAATHHLELSEELLNYFLDPKINAEIARFAQTSTPNQSSLPLIDSRWVSNPAVYPDSVTMKRLELLQDVPKQTALYERIWKEIKSR